MTDHDIFLEDLKQLLDARISQSESRMEDIIDERISRSELRFDLKLDVLRQEMNDGFASVADVVSILNDRTDELDQRVTVLEKKAV